MGSSYHACAKASQVIVLALIFIEFELHTSSPPKVAYTNPRGAGQATLSALLALETKSQRMPTTCLASAKLAMNGNRVSVLKKIVDFLPLEAPPIHLPGVLMQTASLLPPTPVAQDQHEGCHRPCIGKGQGWMEKLGLRLPPEQGGGLEHCFILLALQLCELP